MADKIFFSYSRYDSVFVLKLASDLRNAGLDAWLDQLDIAPGEHWDNEIEKALNNANTLLAIISPKSIASDNVMDEVSFALEEKKRVIPVMVAAIETPFRLRRLQRIDFTGDYDVGFRHLLVALKGEAAVKKVGESPPEENANAVEKDELLWQQSCSANTISAYQRYLKVTGTTTHVEEAWQRIDQLQHAAPVSTATAAPPVSIPLKSGSSSLQPAQQKNKTLILVGAILVLAGLAWGAFHVLSGKSTNENKTIATTGDSTTKKKQVIKDTAHVTSPESPPSPIIQKPEEITHPKTDEAGDTKKTTKRPPVVDVKKTAPNPAKESTDAKATETTAKQPEESKPAADPPPATTGEKKKVTIYSKVVVNLYLSENPNMHERKKSEQFLKFVVSNDVVYAGKVIISKGTVARGSLTIGARQTDIRFYDVVGTDGNLIPLQSDKEHGRRDDVETDKNYVASIKPGTTVGL